MRRLATLVPGLALALGLLAHAAPPSSAPRISPVHHNRRSFKIPFNIPAADVPRYKQVQLWTSSDGGQGWQKSDTKTLDDRNFNFTAPQDGEYLFAVRTVDTKNRLFPADDAAIEPNLKVVVDTKPPSITLDARDRRGSIASVGWEVVDEHIDPASLRLEYQAEGAQTWAQVPIRKFARIGEARWDAGTAEPIRVRGSILDKAGNAKTVTLPLPNGAPSDRNPGSVDGLEPNEPPPIGTFASNGSDRSPPPNRSGLPAMPPIDGSDVPQQGTTGSFDPFSANEPPRRGTPSRGPSQAPPAEPASPPILVRSPTFGLQYAVDDAGPHGPAAVELYVTTDGGQTWFKRGEDPDKASPFPVDLGGEGTFGLKLVAKSAANQGDRPPVNGEPPNTIVEVDGSGPVVKLDPPKMLGSRLVITWQANDPHPAPRPVMISIKADAPDAKWQLITPAPIENNGQFAWVVPSGCPPKVHVRIDVRDSLGNVGFAETPETAAVLVDRSKPKGRILGLDPSARDSSNPSARPIR